MLFCLNYHTGVLVIIVEVFQNTLEEASALPLVL